MRTFLLRMIDLVRGGARDRRITEEVETHLAMLAADYQQRGMSPADARLAARRAFGGVDQMKARYRDQRGLPVIDALAQDVHFAARLLVKDRWVTLAAITALALGIAVNNTVFTVVNAGLIRPLPFPNPDRVVSISAHDARTPFVPGPPSYSELSYPEFEDWRRATRTFAGIAAYLEATMNLGDEGRAPERFLGTYLSASSFGLIGQQPALGRDFRPDDDRPGAPPVVILGHGAWLSRYGADPTVIGRTIRVNGVPATVVGVMSRGFKFPMNTDVWQPLAQLPSLGAHTREARRLSVFGRLADGASRAQAQADLEAIAARLARDYPDTNQHITPVITAYEERYIVPQIETLFLLLIGAVGFVLLIACANIANLLLARSAARSREIAIRASLGATRWRIVRQLLVESVTLALVGGLAGLGLSYFGVRLFASTVDDTGKPYWLDFSMDGTVLMFFAVVCVSTGIVFGLAPALHVSKSNANEVLKEGGRGGSGGLRVRRWSGVLIVGELAMTLVLLSGAGFMMRSFLEMYRVDLGFDTSPLTTMTLFLSEQEYPTADERIALYQRLSERVGGVQGVGAASIASAAPGAGAFTSLITIEGRAIEAGEKPPRVASVAIGPRYFETLGVAVLRGRPFTDVDGSPGNESVIVNERFAAMYFPDQDAIGRRIRARRENAEEPSTWLTIVGVAPAIRQRAQPAEPIVYLPHRLTAAATAVLLVRAKGDAGTVVPQIRDELRGLDPDLPLYDITTLDDLLAFLRWPQRVFGTMFTIFASLGLLLSAVGVYAVIAHSVAQRTQEMGIRMAVGASGAHVAWLVARRVVVQLAIGLLLGLPLAVALGRILPFGSRDLTTLVPLTALLILVALVACLAPARRAARMDPVAALRHD